MNICILEFNVRKYSANEDLLSYKQGHHIYLTIKETLEKHSSECFLIIDFRQIRYITPVCLIEVMKVISELKQQEFQGKYIALRLESTNYNLIFCLTMILNKSNIKVLSIDENGNYGIIGMLTKAQKDALELVKKMKRVTSTEIGNILNISASAAGNRLKDLYDMRLIAREENTLHTIGGRQFIYYCLLYE